MEHRAATQRLNGFLAFQRGVIDHSATAKPTMIDIGPEAAQPVSMGARASSSCRGEPILRE